MTALARNTDPSTSHAAADYVERTGIASTQRTKVMRALRQHPGTTSAELAAVAGLDRYIVARRLPELSERGLAEKALIRRCTVSGIAAVTWEVSE